MPPNLGSIFTIETTTYDEPTSRKDAIKSKDWVHWKGAKDREISSLDKHGTWKYECIKDLPRGTKLMKCKWVYKVKRNADGSIARYKARLVAKGYTQVKGESYTETYSPVVKISSVFAFISYCQKRKLKIYQYDIETAFLESYVDHDIWMECPEGYEKTDEDGNPMCCKLVRGLYGLKQGPKLFNDHLNNRMLQLGFSRLKSDSCLYRKVIVDPKTKDFHWIYPWGRNYHRSTVTLIPGVGTTIGPL